MIERLDFGWFVVAALATYRIAMLITWDNGPWDIFERLREAAGAYEYDQDKRPASLVGKLVTCPYCVGVWAGAFCALLLVTFHPVAYLFLLALGLAGVQCALTRITEGE